MAGGTLNRFRKRVNRIESNANLPPASQLRPGIEGGLGCARLRGPGLSMLPGCCPLHVDSHIVTPPPPCYSDARMI